MRFVEKSGDLFEASSRDFIVHCISADFALGAGVAKQIENRFHVRAQLFDNYPSLADRSECVGTCLRTGHVLNLVTKTKYWLKPSYESLEKSLLALRRYCQVANIHTLAMPRIGCGLDKLKWDIVKEIILRVFTEESVFITVYVKEG